LTLRVYGGDAEEVLAVPSTGVRLGELYVTRLPRGCVLLKVIGYEYVSSVHEQFLAEMSKEDLRATPFRLSYSGSPTTLVARLKPLVQWEGGRMHPVRECLAIGTELVSPSTSDLEFISKKEGIDFGNIRSGYQVLPIHLKLDPEKVISGHVLIAATTGRGKSNLLKTLLWSLMNFPAVGVVVMDPHREYFEILSRHPNSSSMLVSFSPKPSPGEGKLVISTELIRPNHLSGVINLTEAQEREADLLYRQPNSAGEDAEASAETVISRGYGKKWIEALVSGEATEALGKEDSPAAISRYTLSRKLSRVLSLDQGSSEGYGVFRIPSSTSRGDLTGEHFMRLVLEAVGEKKIVVIDTSTLSEEAELLIGNMVSTSLLYERMSKKQRGEKLTPAAVVLEEAPRVLSYDSAPNAYMRIAREGRKFSVGLIAVTQIISVIPEDILANLNTKVYLGMASGKERRAAVDNALSDMSSEDEELVRLDAGEAIVTSSVLGFAVPVKVQLVDELMAAGSKENIRALFPGERLPE
jgi:hypothetical protein